MAFYKDDAVLIVAALKPAHPIKAPLPAVGTILGSLARTYNAVGGLIDTLSAKLGIEPMAVLSVWYVESGTYGFTPGKPVLRFENHKFWDRWGSGRATSFDRHFQFGGHAGVTGAASKMHKFRKLATDPWASFHGVAQTKEYEVFDFAKGLSSKEDACWVCSMGGPQIMGFNAAKCGYATASAQFDAFGADQRWQVLGFFDFCQSANLIAAIKAKDWTKIGSVYNGAGSVYGPKLKAAYDEKAAFDALPRA